MSIIKKVMDKVDSLKLGSFKKTLIPIIMQKQRNRARERSSYDERV